MTRLARPATPDQTDQTSQTTLVVVKGDDRTYKRKSVMTRKSRTGDSDGEIKNW